MTDVSDNTIEVKKPALLSKKKFNELKERFETHSGNVDLLLKDLCEVLNFNPEVGIYNKELGKKMVEYRNKKAAEEGLTLYQWRKLHKKNKN